MPKRTFQPNRRQPREDARLPGAHEDQGGAAVLSRRRAAGRKRVSVSAGIPRLIAPAVLIRRNGCGF